MKNLRTVLVLVWLFASGGAFASLVGAWQSDCQNRPANPDGYLSVAPLDTFVADGTASLRVRAFPERNCRGTEWDLEIIPCEWEVGPAVSGLTSTVELDLRCELDGKVYHWYEIAEVLATTLRFGDRTGASAADRPKKLSPVVYRRSR